LPPEIFTPLNPKVITPESDWPDYSTGAVQDHFTGGNLQIEVNGLNGLIYSNE